MVSQLKLLIPKHLCFGKQLLDSLLKDWFLQDAIDVYIRDSFNLDRHEVRSQKAYERRPLDGEALFALLPEEGSNQLN